MSCLIVRWLAAAFSRRPLMAINDSWVWSIESTFKTDEKCDGCGIVSEQNP